jgi:hypothetical protein
LRRKDFEKIRVTTFDQKAANAGAHTTRAAEQRLRVEGIVG